MGISAIFKRSKAAGSSDGGESKSRLIKRRQNDSAPALAEQAVQPRRAAGRYAPAPASLSSSDVDSLPTPDDSMDERSYGRSRAKVHLPARSSVTTQGLNKRAQDQPGLHSLRTPPLDVHLPPVRELDPFEDSPPRRPLSDFEDPVYIPPLTLAATLFDDYGTMGIGATAPAPAPVSASAPATRDARPKAQADMLSDFNATYNYLFGSLPAAAEEAAGNGPARDSSRTAGGLLSPASTQPSKTPSPVHEDSSDSGTSAASSHHSVDRGLEEERRQEEERKAAELRRRRREMIKQQVAFERMKERHRRQCPAQPSATNIARWQKDAVQTLHASSAAIARGPQPGASFYSLASANASLPNIASNAAQQPGMMPPAGIAHMHPQFPLLVDTAAAARAAGYAQQMHSAPVPMKLSAHPVKLASTPKPVKNPYLSDSSGDNASDSSEETSGSDCSLASLPAASTRPMRSVSQPAANTDSSSETSAKSQSSSRRRVRFHETVSVVFNTRHSANDNCSSDSDNDSSNASVGTPEAKLGSPSLGFAGDDAFDDAAGALGHLRYQIPAIAAMQWLDEAASKPSSGASSRAGSPDRAKNRKPRAKHRIETQPLRDREAEREQQRGEAGEEAHSAGDEDAPKPVDPVTEARRALMGHYSAPVPAMALGNGIPRSSPGVARTSSVRVIGPQSYARPNRFSANANPAKSGWSSHNTSKAAAAAAAKPCYVTSRSSSDTKKQQQQQQQQSAAPKPTSGSPSANRGSRDSDEFDFNNVLQNLSASSFEVATSKEGGMLIRYPESKRETAAAAAADESSDEDDVPLSAIVRSRSEPVKSSASKGSAAKGSGQGIDAARNSTGDGRRRVLVRNSTVGHDARATSMDGGKRRSKWGNLF
ncbi:hypothetical protein LPJ70_001675 [Coemansia sp. RSA 2708]|nr:hypothetical protein LPJ70_001675 [Coemansia sp. RSA 2708]